METKYLLLVFLSFIFYFFVVPILNFYDWIEWWKKQTSMPGQEFDCVDMIAMAYKQNGANWVYDLYALNQTSRKTFVSDVESEFLMTLLMSQSTLVRPTDGSLGPRELCYSVIPTGRQVQWPDNILDWRIKVAEWVGITKHSFEVLEDQAGMKAYHDAGANPRSWEEDEENFLFRTWGFTYDSPIVIAFITKWDSTEADGGVKLHAGNLMTQFLSKDYSPELSGGWKGLLQQYLTRSSTRDLADVESYLWSTVGQAPSWYKHNQDAKKKCKFGNYAGAIGGGAGLVAGGAGVGFMLGGPIGAGIGGLIGTIFGSLQAYGSLTKGCKP